MTKIIEIIIEQSSHSKLGHLVKDVSAGKLEGNKESKEFSPQLSSGYTNIYPSPMAAIASSLFISLKRCFANFGVFVLLI